MTSTADGCCPAAWGFGRTCWRLFIEESVIEQIVRLSSAAGSHNDYHAEAPLWRLLRPDDLRAAAVDDRRARVQALYTRKDADKPDGGDDLRRLDDRHDRRRAEPLSGLPVVCLGIDRPRPQGARFRAGRTGPRRRVRRPSGPSGFRTNRRRRRSPSRRLVPRR